MNEALDEDAFLRKNAIIIRNSREKTFDSLAEDIEALRREYDGVTEPEAWLFIRRSLSRSLFMFAVDKSQPCEVVDQLYDQSANYGFIEPHAEVSSAIDYSAYCYERGRHAKGLSAIQTVKESLRCNKAILPQNLPSFLKPIDTWIGYFEEALSKR